MQNCVMTSFFSTEPFFIYSTGNAAHLHKTKKAFQTEGFCGAYGTRTRDPMRDRHVF